MFNIDTGVAKDFSLGEQRRLEFKWEAFNATNSVRYDVRGAQPSLSYDPSQFGRYNSNADHAALHAVLFAVRLLRRGRRLVKKKPLDLSGGFSFAPLGPGSVVADSTGGILQDSRQTGYGG